MGSMGAALAWHVRHLITQPFALPDTLDIECDGVVCWVMAVLARFPCAVAKPLLPEGWCAEVAAGFRCTC